MYRYIYMVTYSSFVKSVPLYTYRKLLAFAVKVSFSLFCDPDKCYASPRRNESTFRVPFLSRALPFLLATACTGGGRSALSKTFSIR